VKMVITLIKATIYWVAILYALAAGLYFWGEAAGKRPVLRLAWILAGTGCFSNLLLLVLRGILTGRLPLSNGSEFLLSFTWITVGLYLCLETRRQLKGVGGYVMFIAALFMLIVLMVMKGQLMETSPLMPALKSPWLSIHVLTAALAYAGFTLAAGLAAKKLFQADAGLMPDPIYRIIAAAFALLSLSIVSGAVWAEQVWGSYWTWDPKETWALITWIIYALYLHLYKKQNWQGRYACLVVMTGYLLVLFTFFGVNFLLPGLHSYAVQCINNTFVC